MFFTLTGNVWPWQPNGGPGGVLIRALIPLEGLETMARLRGLPHGVNSQMLTGGPGRLNQALDITRSTHNDMDVTRAKSPLQIVEMDTARMGSQSHLALASVKQ